MTLEVLIDGRPARLIESGYSVERAGPGTWIVGIEGRVYRVTRGAASEFQVNGRSMTVEVFDPRDRSAERVGVANNGVHQIAAPMPGRVVRLLVSRGDHVEEGQGLVVVEAMKMQNEMRSPKTGRVADIRASVDDTVSAGQVLVIVE